MYAREFAFGFDVEFLLLMSSALVASAYWSFSVGAAGRGTLRRWKRDPALGKPKLTELTPPYSETWTRGLTFMRCWVALSLPPLLCLPGLMAVSVAFLDRRTTLADAVVICLGVGLGLGLVLVVLRMSAPMVGGSDHESQ
jgi:hypothetical protein